MNFRSAIAAGIIGVVTVSVALAVFAFEQDDKDKIRLAFTTAGRSNYTDKIAFLDFEVYST